MKGQGRVNRLPNTEFEIEETTLKSTLLSLQCYLEQTLSRKREGGDQEAERSLEDMRLQRRREVISSLSSPYFARMDFQPLKQDDLESYYIGRQGFLEKDLDLRIVDWRAPISALFYQGAPGDTFYDCPEGRRRVHFLLRRRLDIANQVLVSIADEFDLRRPGSGTRERKFIDPEDYLKEILSGKQDVLLRDIVATIQAQQDTLIRSSPSQALVIEGVVGSGKTSIALHRLAFLLYPPNKTGIRPRNCIVFGPNRLFLHYISKVLPGLGIEGIPQETLSDWILKKIDLEGYQVTDRVMNFLLSRTTPRTVKIAEKERSQLKSTISMGRLLDKYVEAKRAEIKLPEEGIVISHIGPLNASLRLSQEQLQSIFGRFNGQALERHRDRFIETLVSMLQSEYPNAVKKAADELADPGNRALESAEKMRALSEQLQKFANSTTGELDPRFADGKTAEALIQGAIGLEDLAIYYREQGEPYRLRAARLREDALSAESKKQASDEIGRQIENQVQKFWPSVKLILAYQALMSDKALLTMLGSNLFTQEELTFLVSTYPKQSKITDISDLPAMHYLYLQLYGPDTRGYDHIVIDEAQDIAPLEYEILSRYSRNGSFTILGDLAQAIHFYRGISSWKDVQDAMKDHRYAQQQILKSYRSTYQIMSLANLVLKNITPKGQDVLLSDPIKRNGPKPAFHELTSPRLFGEEIASIVRRAKNQGHKNIAIIARSEEECQRIAQQCRAVGFQEFEVALSGDYDYKGEPVLLPVHLAKGMEFEVVLLVGVDSMSFSDNEFDGRLIYVAITRAMHELHIIWAGTIARPLQGALMTQGL